MEKTSKIYVAGHLGLVGSAIWRELQAQGYENLVGRGIGELDLARQAEAESFFAAEKPEYVFLAAAKVGGIWANDTYPADFIHQNLAIQTNVIHSAHLHGAKKLLFLGSSCIYPKFAEQPIREESLLSGKLEDTNSAYAVAKIAGIEMCRAYRRQHGSRFICAMPTNLYGPNDNYDLRTSHVLPALVRKFHTAVMQGSSEVTLWGTGSPKREFLHVEDLANACVFLMLHYDQGEIINVGTGRDLSIRDLAELVRRISGFSGRIAWDSEKPDGTPRKVLDVSRIEALGWKARISLEQGVEQVYRSYSERA